MLTHSACARCRASRIWIKSSIERIKPGMSVTARERTGEDSEGRGGAGGRNRGFKLCHFSFCVCFRIDDGGPGEKQKLYK